MKLMFFLVAIIGLTLSSCKKADSCDPIPTSLDGKWRMIIVKENTTGSTTTKPSSINGDVDVTFTSTSATNGTFIGNTPSNEIQQNDYLIGTNQTLTISNLSMTKFGETSWGKEFVDNIRSSQEYNFENCGRLKIKTTNKILIFQKL